MKSVFPEIRKNLESHLNGSKDVADFAVIDNSLDALIQIPSEPFPVELIESIYRTGRRAEALILLTRVTPGTSVDHFLLDLLDKEAGQDYSREWFAAADIMLLEHRPGLVHSLLKRLAFQGYVVVCDPGVTCRYRGVGLRSGGDYGPSATKSTFPPWPYYALRVKDGLVTDGPVAVSYTRRIARDFAEANIGRNPNDSIYPPKPSTKDRFGYVAAAAPGINMAIADDESLPIIWTTKEDYRAESERFESDVRTRYRNLIQQLRDLGFLSPDEFNDVSVLNLNIVVVDQRSVRTPLQ